MMLYSVHLLRFFAAAFVVVSHSINVLQIPKPQMHPGDVGVDIFFIISGLVIGLSTRDGDSPVRFAIKRFVRVVPPYWLATLAMVAVLYLTDTGTGVGQTPNSPPRWNEIWLSFTFLSPLSSTTFPVLFPGWTLSYEMLFYLIYGVTLAIFRKHVSIICLIVVAAFSVAIIPNIFWDGYFRPLRYLEFVYGLALSTFVARWKPIPQVGIICFVASLASFYTNRHSNGPIDWGIPSLLFVFGVIQFEGFSFLRTRIAFLLGHSSYAIYLFHFPLMAMVREIAKATGIDIVQNAVIMRLIAFTVAIGGGILIHIWIVDPMVKGLRNILLKRRAVLQVA
jgi:exopolysaccharide production protein ExoZ